MHKRPLTGFFRCASLLQSPGIFIQQSRQLGAFHHLTGVLTGKEGLHIINNVHRQCQGLAGASAHLPFSFILGLYWLLSSALLEFWKSMFWPDYAVYNSLCVGFTDVLWNSSWPFSNLFLMEQALSHWMEQASCCARVSSKVLGLFSVSWINTASRMWHLSILASHCQLWNWRHVQAAGTAQECAGSHTSCQNASAFGDNAQASTVSHSLTCTWSHLHF